MGRIRIISLLLGLLTLSACHLDVTVDVTVEADGSGEIVLVATVDADVVDRLPGLAGGLQLDDAISAGWEVDGPHETEAGGLRVTIGHRFASVAEATALLGALSPPLADATLAQSVTDDDITTTLSGTLTLPADWDGYADPGLVETIGATPFAQQLGESGATPAEALTLELRLIAPGAVRETAGSDGAEHVAWSAVGDGSTHDLTTRAVLAPERGNGWAGPVATAALVLMVVWLLIGAWLAYRVWTARHRRRNRTSVARYR